MMRPLPRFLQIEPVGECNLRCQMCPIQFRREGRPYGPPAFMDFALYCRLVEQFDDLEHLHLQGLGEPFMHPRFFDMVRFAAARGVRVSTNTNMTLLTAARAEQCVSSGLAELHLSLDAPSATTYEAIRVRANFAKVLRNLARIVELKKKLNKAQPSIRIVVVAMRKNLFELTELVELAAQYDVRTIFVQHLCHDFGEATLPAHYQPMRAFIDEQSLLNEDNAVVTAAFDRARKRALALDIDLRLPDVEPVAHPVGTPGIERCDWPWRGAYVSYTGEAMPCCMVATPDRINFGNMVQDGAFQIWNNAEYQNFRDQLASETPPDVCRSCAVYTRTF